MALTQIKMQEKKNVMDRLGPFPRQRGWAVKEWIENLKFWTEVDGFEELRLNIFQSSLNVKQQVDWCKLLPAAYGVMGVMGVKVNKQGQFVLMVPQGPLINLILLKSVHARFYSNYICLSTTGSKADAIFSQNLGKMVHKIQTFHPEIAMQDIYITYKDNNAMNCALDNLMAKPTKPVKATERTTVAMHDFADFRNDHKTWVPMRMLLWDGTVIQNHFVSNMGRFCAQATHSYGQGRKLLTITKSKRIRAKGKLLCVDMLIARAFLTTEPLYGQDQYSIVKKLSSDEDNRSGADFCGAPWFP